MEDTRPPTCTHTGCGQPLAAPGQLPAGSVLQLCAKCRLVAYCSKQCQTADWKRGHKKLCGTRRAGGAGGGGGRRPRQRCARPCRGLVGQTR